MNPPLPPVQNFIDEIIQSDLKSGRVTGVVTRFPPEPNGYLHIGHAKSINLNMGTAVKYGGVCNLRFDDTNPLKEEEEYVNSIIEDARWLGWKGEIFYASDYFEKMYECAELLINKGLAYVDSSSAEEIRLSRGTLTEPGKESPARNRPAAESLALFREMRAGKYADGALVLRAKIDMASPNMNMRDPVIYRVLHAAHHRQGDKWCVYPMYDFAHPIEDAVEKITHSICTLEFEDHRPLYDWVIENCSLSPAPHQYEFARLNITRTIMSKRYLKRLVDEKKTDGWDDPRMPTIAGFRRRGFTPSAIRDFCERIGVAKANSEVDGALLEHCVREELNLTAPRAMAVTEPVKLVLNNLDAPAECKIEINPSAGQETRSVTLTKDLYIERTDFMVSPPPKYHRLTPGGRVRLKGAYIIEHTGHDTDSEGNVTCVYANIIPGTMSGADASGIKVKGVIHWVSAEHSFTATVNEFDYLLLEDDGTKRDFSERLNPESKKTYSARLENMLKDAKPLAGYQFMRKGYYCLDSKSEQGKPVFHRIVGLKDSFNK